jgi:PBP1b-binding outer membrane lipoprotein LpoB
MKRLAWAISVIAVLASGCATQMGTGKSHKIKATKDFAYPEKVLLMPVDVTVYEIDVGGAVEKIPEATKLANTMIASVSQDMLAGNIEFLPPPALDNAEQEAVNMHSAFYDVTAGSAIGALQGGPAWKHKQTQFDYSIGPGLKFLSQKSGVKYGLFIVGSNYNASEGRMATAFALAMLGVGMVTNMSHVHVGLVDLETGDIIWTNNSVSSAMNLKAQNSIQAMLKPVWAKYPGLKTPIKTKNYADYHAKKRKKSES